MAKQKKLPQYILKLNSVLLRKNNWDLYMPLDKARSIPGIVVSLADSQVLSWINELNGTDDYDVQSKAIKRSISHIRKQPKTKENKAKLSSLYEQLYRLQFKEDYICIVMDTKADYDRANQGFYVNGIQYKRLICTTNGVKTSSVVYISCRLHKIIKQRIENGRNTDVPLVPAKLGAYESLIASASLAVSWPKDRYANIPGGIIVVKDCFTNFKADLINIDTSDQSKEPVVSFCKEQTVSNNCSDGCSMMLPSLSCRWNGELNDDYTSTMSGCNLRCAWTKGMTFTFDFIKFAEDIVGASYEHPEKYLITDVWGTKRDVRDAELILTESQLKLWYCYDSWEDYYNNCIENKYTIRVAKTAPHDLDDVRQLNYQFIQSLDLTNEDISELIEPTMNEIKDILGLDPMKSIVYLCGKKLDDNNIENTDDYAKALMIDQNCIKDPYIRSRIKRMINKRIRDAKIGVLDVHGNFQIIAGDLYALAESMFGLKVHGLLKSGEIYSKYWSNEGINRVLCFRAPMSNAHSIVAQNISDNTNAASWFKYIDTCIVVNGWDTMPMALNGFDYDGDILFTTNNAALMRRQKNLPALNCIQQNASKKKVNESDVIRSNKQGFGSKIGSITNRITAITSLMSNYTHDSVEYKVLQYRTQCGQALQQQEIDKAKGILPTEMPKSWYVYSANKIKDDDDGKAIELKKLNQRLCVYKKPYFFGYNYPALKEEYDRCISEINAKLIGIYGKSFDEMQCSYDLSEDEYNSLQYCSSKLPLDLSPSTMNRICWAVEKEFKYDPDCFDGEFDYKVYSSNCNYNIDDYHAIKSACLEYINTINECNKKKHYNGYRDNTEDDNDCFFESFKSKCVIICSNKYELCDILLDLCYADGINKCIVWNICGDTMIENLLKKHNYELKYPCLDKDDGFICCGGRFTIKKLKIKDDADCD